MEGETYYDILEVGENATASEIRTARNRLIHEYHPDKVPEHLSRIRSEAAERTALINEAYAVLGDPSRKQQYDEQLRILRGASTREQSSTQSEGGDRAAEPGGTGAAGPQPGATDSDAMGGAQGTPAPPFQTTGAFPIALGLIGPIGLIVLVLAAGAFMTSRVRSRVPPVAAVSGYVPAATRTAKWRSDHRHEALNDDFDAIVRDPDKSLETKLKEIDESLAAGFDLNNVGSKHGVSPMESLLSHGSRGLATALLNRGLSVDWRKRYCQDQYSAVRAVLSSRGLEVLDVLIEAGFKDDCMRRDGSRSLEGGIVCGVLFGSASKDYSVKNAVRAVEFLASRGFEVDVKCLGKTIPGSVQYAEDRSLREKLRPVADAVLKYRRQEASNF